MFIPNYEPTEEVKSICGKDVIRCDDVLKILMSEPVDEKKAFQIIEKAFSTSVAADFFSRYPERAGKVRDMVFQKITEWIIKKSKRPGMAVSFVVLKELYRMETDGIPVDAEILTKYEETYKQKSRDSIKALIDAAMTVGIEVSENEIRSLDYTFPDEYDNLNIMLEKTRKHIKHANALNTEKMREFLKMLPDGSYRLLSHWDIFGASTGRIQTRRSNSQGLPVEVRVNAIVPKKGYSLVHADYDFEELFLIALMTDDKALLDEIIQGKDLHKVIAGKILNKSADEITDAERKFAKSIDFAFLYGAGDNRLSQIIFESGVDVTFQQVKNVIDSLFSKVKPLIEQIKDQGFVRLINASKVSLERITKKHTYLSRLIQGSGAVILKEVVAKLVKRLPDDAKICFLLHDAIVVETPTTKESEVAEILKDTMNGVLHEYGYELDMPVTVEIKHSENST